MNICEHDLCEFNHPIIRYPVSYNSLNDEWSLISCFCSDNCILSFLLDHSFMHNINLFVRYIQTTEHANQNGYIEKSAPISIIDCYRFGVVPIDIWRTIPKQNIIITETSDNIIPVRTSETFIHPLSLGIIQSYLNKQIPNNKVIIMRTDETDFCSTPKDNDHIKCYNCGETKIEQVFSYPDKISKELRTCYMKKEFCSEQCMVEYLLSRNMHNKLMNYHLMIDIYNEFKRVYDSVTYYMYMSSTHNDFESINPIVDKILIKK